MKTFAHFAAAAGLLLSAVNATAAPTYLSCEFAQASGKAQVFHFSLDEPSETLGVYAPSTGSQRKVKAVFAGDKVSANEGSVAWEIDRSKPSIVRDKRMVGEKDRATCKAISAKEAGFDE